VQIRPSAGFEHDEFAVTGNAPGPQSLRDYRVRCQRLHRSEYRRSPPGEHDHADPTDEQHQELYFVHTGHARFQVDGQDVDAPAGTFVSALDVKTIRSAVALSDNTVVLVIGAEPGAPYEVTPAERAELAAAGLPATRA
jgi:hypothetical protein